MNGRGSLRIDLLILLSAALTAVLGIATNIATKDGKYWGPLNDHASWWIWGAAVAIGLVAVAVRRWERGGGAVGRLRAPPVPKYPEWTVTRKVPLTRTVRALCRRRNASASGTVTVLVGAAGMGKTTLALMACAHRAVVRHFCARIYWITVGRDARQPSQIAGKVNTLIELISGEPGKFDDPRLAGQQLGQLLDQSRRLLLVIDDIWEKDQLDPFLAGGRRCGRLVTTRVPNAVPAGAAVVIVEKMSPDQGRRVLRQDLAGLGAAETDALLAATGRWPLLLRLINRAIADEVDTGVEVGVASTDILHRLREAGPTTADESPHPPAAASLDNPELRRRTVRATIEASTRLLGDDQPARLAELAVFAEDGTVPRILVETLWAATARVDPLDGRRLVRRLADLSLITLDPADGGTITLHDEVRDFLRAELDTDRLAITNSALIDALASNIPPAHFGIAWWEGDHSGYAWDNLVFHLMAAGRLAEAEATVCDVRWIQRRLLLSGVSAPLRDLAQVPTARAKTVHSAVVRAAHLLAPTDPAVSVLDVLESRMVEEATFRPQFDALGPPTDRHALRNRWPLPDLPDAANPQSIADVTAMALAPDGTWLVTGGQDGRVRIWDIGFSSLQEVLFAHERWVTAIAIAPDGTWFATGGHNRTVHIWRRGGTEPEHSMTLPESARSVEALAVFPDSHRLAVLSSDGTLRAWDQCTNAVTYLLADRLLDNERATLARDGSWLPVSALTSPPPHLGQVFGALRVFLRPRHYRHAGFLIAVAPDDAWIACQEWDTVWILKLGGELRCALRGGRDWLKAIAITPDGRGLSATWRGRIWTWDVAAESVRRSVPCPPGPTALAYGPDETWLAVGTNRGSIHLVDTATGAVLRHIAGHAASVRAVAITVDGKRMASFGYDHMVRVWELGDSGGSPTTDLPRATAVACHPGGHWVAVGDEQGGIHLRDPDTGVVQHSLRPNLGRLNAVALSADGKWGAVGTATGLHRWDTVTHTFRRILVRPGLRLVISADGSWLITDHGDRAVAVWRATDGGLQQVIRGRLSFGPAFAAATDGSLLVVASDHEAILWDSSSGTVMRKFKLSGQFVTAVAVSPGGDWFATTGYDGIVDIWDADSGALMWRSDRQGRGYCIRTIAIDPGGAGIAVGHEAGVVRVWRRDNPRPVAATRIDGMLAACIWTADSSGLLIAGSRGAYRFDLHRPGQFVTLPPPLHGTEPRPDQVEDSPSWGLKQRNR